jgi:hypothetical protein
MGTAESKETIHWSQEECPPMLDELFRMTKVRRKVPFQSAGSAIGFGGATGTDSNADSLVDDVVWHVHFAQRGTSK